MRLEEQEDEDDAASLQTLFFFFFSLPTRFAEAGELSIVGLGSTANGFEGFSVETNVLDWRRRGDGGGGGGEEEGGGVSMKEKKSRRVSF